MGRVFELAVLPLETALRRGQSLSFELVYAVMFSLRAFATFRRDGLQLSSNFVGTVNAELRVGAVTETITVSGQAPLVDVGSVSKGTVVSQETLAVLPTSKSFNGSIVPEHAHR